MPAESVHCVVTSPPYWGLRDYGSDGQLGLEATPEAYVANMVDVFREVRRVLRDDGTLWLNLGDSYATGAGSYRNPGSDVSPIDHGGKQGYTKDYARAQPNRMPIPGLKPKDLVGIPWRVAFALQADGWYLRSDIIWAKPNPMPESVTDRPTKAHEYLFLLAKSARYYFDAEAVREPAESGPSDLREMAEGRVRIGGLVKEQTDPLLKASGLTNIGRKRSVGGKQLASAQASAPSSKRRMGGFNDRWDASEDNGTAPVGRNIRTVWTIATEPYPGAHFATFPRKLVEPCVKAGCPEGGTVLDPFAGSGTTLLVAQALGRRGIGIDLNPEYLQQALVRNAQTPLGLVG
jgi:DNA modification methylase